MAKKKDYPHWAYKSKKEWLRDVRKRWVKFRKTWKNYPNGVYSGCVYYPDEVYKWLHEFEKMDAKMKEYYKNA